MRRWANLAKVKCAKAVNEILLEELLQTAEVEKHLENVYKKKTALIGVTKLCFSHEQIRPSSH